MNGSRLLVGNTIDTYPNRSALFGSGVPVTILGSYGQEVRKILGRHWLRRARHRSSRLLKELSQPCVRDEEYDQRFTGDVARGVPCPTGHMDVIPCFPIDPFVAPWDLLESLCLAGDDVEVLRSR
jgi:hypothetical protein